MYNKSMFEYGLASFIFHFAIAIFLFSGASNKGLNSEKIEVNIVESVKTDAKPLFPKSPRKYAKPGEGEGTAKKQPDVDLSVYANRLKLKVDPVWVRNIQPYLGKTGKKYYTEVFIDVDKHGNIKSLRILKSSGYLEVDEVAIQTLREVGTLPIPPETLVKEGIIWEFSTS